MIGVSGYAVDIKSSYLFEQLYDSSKITYSLALLLTAFGPPLGVWGK